MPGKATDKTAKIHWFEVLVSFSGLDKGERFPVGDEEYLAWASQHADTGYLRDVTEGDADVRGAVGQG